MGDEDLTEFIRARTPIKGLAVFGGGKKSDDLFENGRVGDSPDLILNWRILNEQ
ncbi:MAG: hypothetical protein LUD14_04235 [Clostridiales bacterium]|nr:hypothetical protein [Clostridiales bacterium]